MIHSARDINPIRQLRADVELLRAASPRRAAVWDAALEEFLGREGEDRRGSFERALGLTAPRGAPIPVEDYRREQRNAVLAQAFREAGSLTRLAREITAYFDRVSIEHRGRDRPAESWPPVRRLIHRAARITGGKLPRSPEGLKYALDAEIRSPIGFRATSQNITATETEPTQ